MKKMAILISLVSLTPLLHAQDADTWPQSGAVWQYCLVGDNYDVWLLTFAYTTDTVIGDHSYAVVQHTEVDGQPIAADGSSWWIPEENMRSYIRQSGDTVYRYVNGQDYLFMVLGLDVNEGFSTFRSMYDDWNQWNCNDELPLQVLSVAEPEYAGVTYRELSLQDLDPYFNLENSNGNFYTFIEGIGLKDSFVYMTPEHSGIGGDLNESGDMTDCLGSVLHLPVSTLCHYHDENVSIDFLPGMNVSSLGAPQERSLSAYPNPSQGAFAIQLEGDKHTVLNLQILDLSGKLLAQYSQVATGQMVDANYISPGLYLLHATDGKRNYVNKLVLR